MVHCAALGQHGRGHDGKSRRAAPRSGQPPSRDVDTLSVMSDTQTAPAERGEHLRPCAGRPLARVTSTPRGVEHQRGRRAQRCRGGGPGRGGARRRPRRARRPGTSSATSPRTRRVARQGAQNAEENCSSVARSPSGWPRPSSEPRLDVRGRGGGRVGGQRVRAAEASVAGGPPEPEPGGQDQRDDEDPGTLAHDVAQPGTRRVDSAAGPDVTGATGPRGDPPGRWRTAPRRLRDRAARRRAGRYALYIRRKRRSTVKMTAFGRCPVSRRRTAAAARRCRPRCDRSRRPGRRDPTGRSPTSTEHTDSTSASRGRSACSDAHGGQHVGQRRARGDRRPVGLDAGRGPRRRPVADGDAAHRLGRFGPAGRSCSVSFLIAQDRLGPVRALQRLNGESASPLLTGRCHEHPAAADQRPPALRRGAARRSPCSATR